MRLLNTTSRLDTRAAGIIFALSILIFTICLIGHNITFAAERDATPHSAPSQDISGVWLGHLSENMADGRVGHSSLYLRLRQSGAQISGVAGDSEATASPIEDAVLSGKHLKFSVTGPGGPEGSVLLKVELDANGDAMEGKGHFLRSRDRHAWDVEIKVARKQ